MKHKLVIVGAGLAGCILADELSAYFDITLIESSDNPNTLHTRIQDVGISGNLVPIASNGLGGTTQFWHNGLIEVDESIFSKKWPFPKSILVPYYKRAYLKLSEIEHSKIERAVNLLKGRLESCGIPRHLMRQGLYYPHMRINAWKKFKLSKRVNLIYGSIIDLSFCDGSVEAIAVDIDGKVDYFSADFFILSAGGLGTPIILQKLAAHCPSQAIRNAGCFYEDHPTGFIGRLQIKSPIFKYTNFSANSIKGFLRMPLVVEQEGYLVSFQLRPSALVNGRSRFTSLLSQIRNDPFNLFNYLKVLASADDLLEIVSLKLGINFPTRNYSVLMVSEQPIKNQLDVTFSAERKAILRNWILDGEHIALIERAFLKLILELGEIVDGSELFSDWSKHISSSAHHSGTARMSVNELRGVCDENGKIHDLSNLFICDGSLIPASGFSNTGLTIGALAIKLGDLLKSIIKER